MQIRLCTKLGRGTWGQRLECNAATCVVVREQHRVRKAGSHWLGCLLFVGACAGRFSRTALLLGRRRASGSFDVVVVLSCWVDRFAFSCRALVQVLLTPPPSNGSPRLRSRSPAPRPRQSGEAQIAVVDLLGMLSGIGLCTLVGTSRQTIVAAYVILSLVDISAIYNEIRAVCFSVLNHERTHLLVRDYVASGSDPNAMVQTPVVPRAASPLEPLASLLPTITVGEVERAPLLAPAAGAGAGASGVVGGVQPAPLVQPGRQEGTGEAAEAAAAAAAAAATTAVTAAATGAAVELPAAAAAGGDGVNNGRAALTIEEKEEAGKGLLSSPSTVSRRENIFLSSRLTTNVFKTWSQVRARVYDCGCCY